MAELETYLDWPVTVPGGVGCIREDCQHTHPVLGPVQDGDDPAPVTIRELLTAVKMHAEGLDADDPEEWPRAETDCSCRAAGSDHCPCEADGDDGLCACCRNDSHNGQCGFPDRKPEEG